MNDNAKKWVAALRSGEFTQAKTRLRTKDGYCCLGVACELFGRENGIDWSVAHSEYEFLESPSILPFRVSQWLGLKTCTSEYDSGKTRPFGAKSNSQLTENNDDGMSFTEIADIIEGEPEGLFV